MTTARRRLVADAAIVALPALVICGPLLLGSGYWLVGDMVFVPHQPWKAAWVGTDGALPRAVPMDAFVSLATHVVPGWVVQRLLLVGGLVLGGLGMARLVRDHVWPARAAAVLLLTWNPWVYERLLIGQWAILLGYLLLPWVVLAARRLRADARDWGPAAVTLAASAVCSPASGLMAAGVLGVLALGRDRAVWVRAVLIAAAANLTWVVPALVASRSRIATDGVFAGFAARGESSAGVLPSLLSMGGIWKTSIVPAERTSVVVVLLACALSVAALTGLARGREPDRVRFAVIGGVALLIGVLPALPAGADLLEAAATHVDALALLRDSHRFLAPLGMVLAVGAAHAVTAVAGRVRPGAEALWGVVGLLVLAPAVLLPSLAWGATGELQQAHYPQGWQQVADRIEASGDDAVTVVLPWRGSYRGFDWNHRRAVLDPAPRALPGSVLIDDRVLLDDRIVPAEDPRTDTVTVALAANDRGAALRSLGVRWVLVEGDLTADLLPALPAPVYDDGQGLDRLRLIDLAATSEDIPEGSIGHAEPPVRTTPLGTPEGKFAVDAVRAAQAALLALLFSGVVRILRYRE